LISEGEDVDIPQQQSISFSAEDATALEAATNGEQAVSVLGDDSCLELCGMMRHLSISETLLVSEENVDILHQQSIPFAAAEDSALEAAVDDTTQELVCRAGADASFTEEQVADTCHEFELCDMMRNTSIMEIIVFEEEIADSIPQSVSFAAAEDAALQYAIIEGQVVNAHGRSEFNHDPTTEAFPEPTDAMQPSHQDCWDYYRKCCAHACIWQKVSTNGTVSFLHHLSDSVQGGGVPCRLTATSTGAFSCHANWSLPKIGSSLKYEVTLEEEWTTEWSRLMQNTFGDEEE
jgi:hypothetical protein